MEADSGLEEISQREIEEVVISQKMTWRSERRLT